MRHDGLLRRIHAFLVRRWLRVGLAAALVPLVVAMHISAVIAQDWEPTEEQVQAITQRTYEFLSARDGRNYDHAYALLRHSLKAYLSFENFRLGAERFNDMAGAVRERKIKRITWYKDPPDAPETGVYAAVDLVSTFQNVDRHCGYLVFHQEPSGEFLIVREEENYMDRSTEESIRSQHSQERVEALWAELARNCPQ